MENNALLNNFCVKEEIKMEISKYFVLNVNQNRMYQDFLDKGKTVSQGNVIALNTSLKKED